jgi:anthranilate/para-aminobenzoate synthase component II
MRVAARTESGDVMAIAHRTLPVWGVQFHPESVLTEHGDRIIANFLAL